MCHLKLSSSEDVYTQNVVYHLIGTKINVLSFGLFYNIDMVECSDDVLEWIMIWRDTL